MKTISPPTLWFILGREPKLSAAELITVLGVKNHSFNVPIFKAQTTTGPHELMHTLGGTIKIGQELGDNLSEEELLQLMIEELKTVKGKIHFGLSLYSESLLNTSVGARGPSPLQVWGKKIKNILKEEGLSVRYVENREPILSSVTVEKNGLTKRGREFLIQMSSHGEFSLAKTLAVQPFEEWSRRDFGRPGRDDKSGMLPPKLATIMINLCGNVGARGLSPLPDQELILLDPFCGSGTILTEAQRLGYNHLIGTDVSEKATEDAKKNAEWTQQHIINNKQTSIKIFQSDIKNLSEKISSSSINLIVTEPYLGKPLTGRETKSGLEQQIKELKNLYLQAFGEFHKILKNKGRVVFVIPRFKYKNEWLAINCTEEIKKRGFKIIPLLPEHEFLLYARANQFVGREIWRFEKI